MNKEKRRFSYIGRAAVTLCAMLLLISGLAVSVSAATLPSQDEVAECWFYIFPSDKVGTGYLEFPNGTTFSNIKVSNKKLSAKKKVENWDGDKHTFLMIQSKKSVKSATLKFTAKLGSQKKNYKIKVVAMTYKNPYKTVKIGSKNYASKYKKYDNTYTLKKAISGKLQVKANKGFTIRGIEIYDTKTDKTKKVKNGSKITLKKGQILQVYYYYKAYKCNGGLGVIMIE